MRHSGDDAIPASCCRDGVNALLSTLWRAKAEANTLVLHQLVPVLVEHNVVQSNFMALAVHGSIASAGAFSYARHLRVARKCL